MSINYHALGICTIEEGRELKDAGYRKAPQLADAYWHAEERTLYWVRAERESDVSLTCPTIANAVYLKTSIDNYYIRLPRLQELLEWLDAHNEGGMVIVALTESKGSVAVNSFAGSAGDIAGRLFGNVDGDLLTSAVKAVLHVLRKGENAPPEKPAWKVPTLPVALPMRYEYRATTSNNLTFQDTTTFMTTDGWEPFQIAAPTSGTIYQVWRRWVPVEVKS